LKNFAGLFAHFFVRRAQFYVQNGVAKMTCFPRILVAVRIKPLDSLREKHKIIDGPVIGPCKTL
jgi:hypothetical protein